MVATSPSATQLLAHFFACTLQPADCYLLYGSVGAGKSYFRCVAAGCTGASTFADGGSSLTGRPRVPSLLLPVPAAVPSSVRRPKTTSSRCRRPPSCSKTYTATTEVCTETRLWHQHTPWSTMVLTLD